MLSPVAIRALYGAGFGETIPTLRVLFVEVTLAGTVMVLAQAPMALGRPGVTTILQAVGLVLTIPLMLWLVPKEGIVGAAYALLITTTCRLVILLAAFPVLLKLPAPSLWFTRNDADSVHRIYEAAVSRLLVRQT
jgi:O-antigen/teichoic acid export membrane protein